MPYQRDLNNRVVWTAERLRAWFRTFYGNQRVVVLANREPFRHDRSPDRRVIVSRTASGLVTALEPLIQTSSGVWVAHGAGTADKDVVDRDDGLDVPPGRAEYRLRRVWLSPREQRGYYDGFANEGLWALCHRAHVKPIFRSHDFDMYAKVNARFADAVCEEADRHAPLVLVQDYHFALAPGFIRERLPHATVVAFWHIPWPDPRDFAACPWGRQLLIGLLGSSSVGFQTPGDCRNFMDTVEHVLGAAHVDRGEQAINYRGRRTIVRAYPVSVEWPSRIASAAAPVAACRADVFRQLRLAPHVTLGIGVDRLDYTKGIEEKFLAVERLLESRPELRERFVFVQLAEPTRANLRPYRAVRSRVLKAAARINRRFGVGDYRPIVFLEGHHETPEVYRFLRAADLCLVGSLHDGMNLVAKEFVTARDDCRGVLVLSRFAGAAQQLTSALLVNPYAIDETASALARALSMPADEQARRLRTMRSVVSESNTYWWAGQMLQDVAGSRHPLHVARSVPLHRRDQKIPA